MRKGPAVADEDLTELVTIKYPPTGETIERPRGALPSFVNETQGWVVLDAAGRVNPRATTAATPTTTKEQ
jgi:hypothetical protein